MKRIKILLVIIICLITNINQYKMQTEKVYYLPTVTIDIKNLDELEQNTIVLKQVLRILNDNQINIYTNAGEYVEGTYINEVYSNFSNISETQKYIKLKSGTYPSNDQYISNIESNNKQQSGVYDYYFANDQSVNIYNLAQLKNKNLNRKYYFIDINQNSLSKICQVLNKYEVDYTVERESDQLMLHNWSNISYFILILICITQLLECVKKSRDYAIMVTSSPNSTLSISAHGRFATSSQRA